MIGHPATDPPTSVDEQSALDGQEMNNVAAMKHAQHAEWPVLSTSLRMTGKASRESGLEFTNLLPSAKAFTPTEYFRDWGPEREDRHQKGFQDFRGPVLNQGVRKARQRPRDFGAVANSLSTRSAEQSDFIDRLISLQSLQECKSHKSTIYHSTYLAPLQQRLRASGCSRLVSHSAFRSLTERIRPIVSLRNRTSPARDTPGEDLSRLQCEGVSAPLT